MLQDTEAKVMLTGQILELPRSLTAKGGNSIRRKSFMLQQELSCASCFSSRVGGERE